MTKPMHVDQQYIKALKEQDPILCQDIYDKFLPKVISMIKAKGGNGQEAKEAFQDALLAIMLVLKTKDIVLTTSFGAYLKGICYHKFIDLCRKQKKELRNETELRLSGEALFDSADIDQLLIKEKQLNLIWQSFEKLADSCKKIIKGKLEGLSAAKLMKQINFTKSANAFYVKRFDCMQKLKSLIEKHADYAMIKVQSN